MVQYTSYNALGSSVEGSEITDETIEHKDLTDSLSGDVILNSVVVSGTSTPTSSSPSYFSFSASATNDLDIGVNIPTYAEGKILSIVAMVYTGDSNNVVVNGLCTNGAGSLQTQDTYAMPGAAWAEVEFVVGTITSSFLGLVQLSLQRIGADGADNAAAMRVMAVKVKLA